MQVWDLRSRFRAIPALVLSEMVTISGGNMNLIDSRSLAMVTPGDVLPPMPRECKNPLPGARAGTGGAGGRGTMPCGSSRKGGNARGAADADVTGGDCKWVPDADDVGAPTELVVLRVHT